MIGRIFLVFVLLAVSFYVVKYLRAKLDDSQKFLKKDTKDQKMVKCQHCGLHIPDSEAIKQGDKIFCTLEHAKQEL